ncbi:MAG: hypothetical protein BJ554DRAFT_8050, partial [Olpidium bornovanus]
RRFDLSHGGVFLTRQTGQRAVQQNDGRPLNDWDGKMQRRNPPTMHKVPSVDQKTDGEGAHSTTKRSPRHNVGPGPATQKGGAASRPKVFCNGAGTRTKRDAAGAPVGRGWRRRRRAGGARARTFSRKPGGSCGPGAEKKKKSVPPCERRIAGLIRQALRLVLTRRQVWVDDARGAAAVLHPGRVGRAAPAANEEDADKMAEQGGEEEAEVEAHHNQHDQSRHQQRQRRPQGPPGRDCQPVQPASVRFVAHCRRGAEFRVAPPALETRRYHLDRDPAHGEEESDQAGAEVVTGIERHQAPQQEVVSDVHVKHRQNEFRRGGGSGPPNKPEQQAPGGVTTLTIDTTAADVDPPSPLAAAVASGGASSSGSSSRESRRVGSRGERAGPSGGCGGIVGGNRWKQG